MSNVYTNTVRSRNSSEFAQTGPAFTGALATFKSLDTKPKIATTVVPMVRGSVRYAVPVNVAAEDNPPAVVTESVTVEFNVRQGGLSLSALRNEVVRLFDAAVADYQLANGIVPPTEATFADE